MKDKLSHRVTGLSIIIIAMIALKLAIFMLPENGLFDVTGIVFALLIGCVSFFTPELNQLASNHSKQKIH